MELLKFFLKGTAFPVGFRRKKMSKFSELLLQILELASSRQPVFILNCIDILLWEKKWQNFTLCNGIFAKLIALLCFVSHAQNTTNISIIVS